MSELMQFLERDFSKIEEITKRKAYGLDAYYIKEKVFLVIEKDEHLILKVEDYLTKKKIFEIPNVLKWSLNGKVMEDWFKLPQTFNKKKNRLFPILEMVYSSALIPKKKKKMNKKPHKRKARTPDISLIKKGNKVENEKRSIMKRILSKMRRN